MSAQAVTFQVTTLADNESDGCAVNQCTLREAVSAANSNLTTDTITFQSGLTGVIVLNGSQIIINSNLTIDGPGARVLSVSGNNQSRVFVVSNIGLTGITVSIDDLTITGGSSQLLDIDGALIGDGGGILNAGRSTLNLTDVTVTGNSSTSFGGGIATRALVLSLGSTTTTNITQSTISNNNSVLVGGGISNLSTDILSSAVTTITNSTVSNNSSLAEGGGISNTAGTLNLTNNTISNNNSTVAGGGVVNVAGVLVGTVRLRNTIIANNTAVVGTNLISSDVLGIFVSLRNNLIGNNLDATVDFAASVTIGGPPIPNANGDIVGSIAVGYQIVNPLLGGLQNNGGQTNTRLPLAGSPAIDTGNSCVTTASCPTYNAPALTVEQRGPGFPRLVGASVDIGATEGPAVQPATFTVTTLADDETDGCAVNLCTLREAITDANNDVDTNTINFQTGLIGTITLTRGQLVVSSNMTIDGPGARVVTVNGNAASRVFLVATPVSGGDFTATISGLTITNGRTLPVVGVIGDGGGILNGALLGVISGKSTLNLVEVAVLDNEATSIGGGIATRLGAETNIERSLIAGNKANALPLPIANVGGGGISNAVLSTTTISNSTVTNNTSLAAGGGILNAAGIVHSTNNTISHNKSVLAGGGVVSLVGVTPPLGVTYLRNTIIARNDAFFDTNIISSDVLGVLGSFQSLGHNLIGNNLDAELNFAASVTAGGSPTSTNLNLDIVGSVAIGYQIVNPLLGNLTNNGGPTDTRLPDYSSPAVNRGDNCVTTNTCAVNPYGRNPHTAHLLEQRSTGFPRLQETAVEIGAVEVLAPLAAGVSIAGRVTDGNGTTLSRVRIRVSDASGNVRTALTNGFGYFRIDDLQPGASIIVQATHKQYSFAPQFLSLSEDVTELTIVSLSGGQKNSSDILKVGGGGSTSKISRDF